MPFGDVASCQLLLLVWRTSPRLPAENCAADTIAIWGRISSDAMWRLSVAWAIGRTPVEHRQTLPGPVRRAYTEAKGYGLTLRNKHDTLYTHSVMAPQSATR